MDGFRPRFTWRLRDSSMPAASSDAGAPEGVSQRLMRMLSARGVDGSAAVAGFLGEPQAGLHDPLLLPDASPFLARVARATTDGERVLVFGDFDADGLTGLAILTVALRRLGLDTATYVPDRAEEGHGLSAGAVMRAAAEGRTLIVTADCGTSSGPEIELARSQRIDVLVTDHHRPPAQLPPAAAVVNPMRSDSAYPDRQLSGAGVAFKCAQLLIAGEALRLLDLAAIGTVADVAPLTGENRAIVRLGLDVMRLAPRPGIAALLEAARIERGRLDPEKLAFGLVPRLNAGGRVGDAALAARLLLATDRDEADALAAELEAANDLRRELLAAGLAEARAAVAAQPDGPITVVGGAWVPGIVGLLAGRLADERGRPAIVFCTTSDPWRGSARSSGDFDLAGALSSMAELFDRFGGHSAAAGCHLRAANFDEFRRRLLELAGPVRPIEPTLDVDIVVDASEVDYRLLADLAQLEPCGAGNPQPLVGVRDIVVGRVRPASGGHTQLVLRKGAEVLDGICFGRDDLSELLTEGQRVDLVTRVTSRLFGGYESIQLEVRDIGPARTLDRLTRQAVAAASGARADQPAANALA